VNWIEAKKLIRDRVKPGTDLNTPKSSYRFVQDISDQGIAVLIGKTSIITISWDMLANCYQEMCRPTGYNRAVFKSLYPKKCRNRPCHVHVVGQIFVRAGLARVDGRTYHHLT